MTIVSKVVMKYLEHFHSSTIAWSVFPVQSEVNGNQRADKMAEQMEGKEMRTSIYI